MEKLVADLRRIFIDDHINTEDVQKVLEAYKSEPADWKQYAHFDPHKYTRNLVDSGNGKYNLMILCWGPGMGSSIHDHTDSHCFVKVLDGELIETRYAWPKKQEYNMRAEAVRSAKQDPTVIAVQGENGGGSTVGDDAPLKEIGRDTSVLNGVTYINDQIGLHRMENPSHSSPAITLHLYIPPYSSCYSFDQRTGRKQKCMVTFYTKYGQKVDYGFVCKDSRLQLSPSPSSASNNNFDEKDHASAGSIATSMEIVNS